MAAPLTREVFQRLRTVAASVSRRDSRILATFSVVGGVVQLVFFRWAEPRLEPGLVRAIGLPGFLTYLALVGLLLWRLEAHKRSLGPRCPQCGTRLTGLSERVAAATGKCDNCGGVVFDEEHTD
jgi:hypothetical protein